MELIVTEKLVQAVVEDADVTFPAIDGCVHMKVVMPSWYEEHLQSSYKETLKPHFFSLLVLNGMFQKLFGGFCP